MFLGSRQIDELWRRRLAWLLLIAFALSQFPLQRHLGSLIYRVSPFPAKVEVVGAAQPYSAGRIVVA